MTKPLLTAVALLSVACGVQAAELEIALRGADRTELAPHLKGNVYAPEIHQTDGKWRMWYGGQGADGHDRIHLAESTDGQRWVKRGVVIDRGSDNHVNDPTVVKVGPVWWMFYTVAEKAEADEIAAATSPDGIQWTKRGVVLACGTNWDSAKVGRPSVLYENGVFRLWYDGQPTAEAASTNEKAKSVKVRSRAVGYAESKDGLRWERRPEPVFQQGAGAVQVSHSARGYLMVFESHEGTLWAESADGLNWHHRGLLAGLSGGDADRHGQVTPFLIPAENGSTARLFFGAASAGTWDHNSIAVRQVDLPPAQPATQWIGYTELETNLPGGRHANVRTMRAAVVKADGTERRLLAPELATEPETWTQFAGWSPDGSFAIIARGWENPENAKWEEEHRQFRMEPGQWMLDSYSVDLQTGRSTNLTGIERVSHYNGGLFFLPDGKGMGFTPLIKGVSKPFLMDLDGRNKRDVSGDKGGFAYGYSASPDGKWISYHEDYQIYIAHADGTNKRKVETGKPFNFGPQWSPDGDWLLFSSGERGHSNPYVVRKDGSGLKKLADLNGYQGWILFLDIDDFHEGSSDTPVWSTSGQTVFYTAKTDKSVELFQTTLDGKGEQLTHSPEGTLHYHPKPSPNGQWIAYGSKRNGVRQLVIMNLTTHQESQITNLPQGKAAMWPHWQPPAKKLP